MGGLGSGNWWGWKTRKTTVEESLVVSMHKLRKQLYKSSAGTFTWTWTSGYEASVGYRLAWKQDAPTFTLHYRWRDTEEVRIPVSLEMTLTQFGGRRWWFVCPVVLRGVPCRRRAGKLYLPPEGKYFGCRRCHDLRYRSSQTAHQEERMECQLGKILGCNQHDLQLLMGGSEPRE